jgi:hypothetical protein
MSLLDTETRRRKKRSLSPSSSVSPNSSRRAFAVFKCSKCQKNGRKSCSQSACFKCCTDGNCEGHKDVREKEDILNGTHEIIKVANKKRALAAKPHSFHDPAFQYLGETILIWSFREYMSNSKWRDEAIRKSLKNHESRKQLLMVEKEAQRKKDEKERNRNTGSEIVSKLSEEYSSDHCSIDMKKDHGIEAQAPTHPSSKLGKESRKKRFRRIMNELFEKASQSV